MDKPTRKSQYVGIVMLSGKFCNFRHPTQCCTNSAVLVGYHACSYSGTADDDPCFIQELVDGFRQRMNDIRIINAVRTICPEIFYLIPEG